MAGLASFAIVRGVELSRCAEPNTDSIQYINLIESVRLKKDVMEHHNDKGISMKHVQIKPYIQSKTALQHRASIKKANPYSKSVPINLDSASAKSNKRFVPCKQRNA
jgi:hypothetical protein